MGQEAKEEETDPDCVWAERGRHRSAVQVPGSE